MRFGVYVHDLLDHYYLIDSFATLEEAVSFFRSESYTPAGIYDDLLELAKLTDDDYFEDSLKTYEFTRLDREETNEDTN